MKFSTSLGECAKIQTLLSLLFHGLVQDHLYAPQEIPKVVADKEKLKQVINNLIDNAIKYTKQGRIELCVDCKGGDVEVRVKDTGIGLPADKIPFLFEKYSRGKDSVMHATGLGLGLYVARVIIKQHNGEIWAESQGEGAGSTFIFKIPVKGEIQANTTSILDLTKVSKEQN